MGRNEHDRISAYYASLFGSFSRKLDRKMEFDGTVDQVLLFNILRLFYEVYEGHLNNKMYKNPPNNLKYLEKELDMELEYYLTLQKIRNEFINHLAYC